MAVRVQQDDTREVYPVLESADRIVPASLVYDHSFTGQFQRGINRIYTLDKPKNLKKAALTLSSGWQNKSEEKLDEPRMFGVSLK